MSIQIRHPFADLGLIATSAAVVRGAAHADAGKAAPRALLLDFQLNDLLPSHSYHVTPAVMDPITVVGLVASIISIVDFAVEVSLATKKLITEGNDALPNNVWLEGLTERNKTLADHVNESARKRPKQSRAEKAAVSLAKKCQDESDGLIKELAKLKLPKDPNKVKSALKAVHIVLKTMLKSGDLEARQLRLERLERQLSALLLCVIRESQDQEFADLKILVAQSGKNATTRVLELKTEVLAKLERLQKAVDAGFTSNEKHWLSAEEEQKVQRVLDSFKYPEMEWRKGRITDAEDGQYQWAVSGGVQPTVTDHDDYRPLNPLDSLTLDARDNPHDGHRNDKTLPIEQWLRSDSRIIWISGLPASGKSTMMKYLQRDAVVVRILEEWAQPNTLLQADHYFWVAGSKDQRSNIAMLRNICFQLLAQARALVGSLCPQRLAKSTLQRDWTEQELVGITLGLTRSPGISVCLFIDGLDECEDKQQGSLTRILGYLCTLTNIKIIVSSRPWAIFETCFKTRPSVRLESRNAPSIFRYVCRRLQQSDSAGFANCHLDHALFEACTSGKRWKKDVSKWTPAADLIYEICSAAQSDFLWTESVVDSVAPRVEEGEGLAAIRTYVNGLPQKLDDYYFESIYERIQGTYREGKLSETAMALRLAITFYYSRSRLLLGHFWLLRDARSDPQGMVHNPNFSACQKGETFDVAGQAAMARRAASYLKSCCRDFFVWDSDLLQQNAAELWHEGDRTFAFLSKV